MNSACIGRLAVALLMFVACHSAMAAERPNILLIVADDLGYADVGFHGCKDIPTPNLDALAASGVRFTSGYVSAPYCAPSRAGLLTGRYQTRFGFEFNPSGFANGLPLSETTLADRLRAAGYTTGLIGKWHLGGKAPQHPQKRGFDEFFGFLGGGHSYFNYTGILRGTEPVDEGEYLTDAFGREACEFIERHKGHPWFLYLAFNAVHTPLQADDTRLNKFSNIKDKTRHTYDAMTSALDDAVGRVRNQLAATGEGKNTLIVFISDNGGPVMVGTTVNGSRNTPLRGSKRTTLEGGIRVPFVMVWPGHLEPAVCKAPVISLDAHVTALAAAGIEKKSGSMLDGVNLLPYLKNEVSGSPHQALCWRFGSQMAIRMGRYKLVRYDTTVDTNVPGTHKPVTPCRLYDLDNDIGEKTDLAQAMPEKVAELKSYWDSWNKEQARPLWTDNRLDSDGAEPRTGPKKQRKAKVAK